MIDFSTEFGQKVKRHLDQEYFIWFTTVGADLTPQPRPVWFIWDDGKTFLIFSQPGTHKVAHIKEHPNVALHFNTDEKADEDVIVFVGVAEIDAGAPPAYQVPDYVEKYKGGMAELGSNPEKFSGEYSVAIRVKPGKVRGW